MITLLIWTYVLVLFLGAILFATSLVQLLPFVALLFVAMSATIVINGGE